MIFMIHHTLTGIFEWAFFNKKRTKIKIFKALLSLFMLHFLPKGRSSIGIKFSCFHPFFNQSFPFFFSWYINEAEAHRSEFCEWMRAFYSEVEKSCASKCKDLTQLLLIDKLNYTSIYFIERSEGQFN